MTPIRVLYVVERSDRNRILNALVDALHPEQVRYDVVVMDQPGPLHDDMAARGVDVAAVAGASAGQLALAPVHVAQLLRRQSYQVVHSNGYRPGIVTEVARRLVRPTVPSVLGRHHNLEHHIRGYRLHARVDGFSAAAASHVAAVSDAVRSTLIRVEGVSADRITVVPNGVDWNALTPTAAAVAEWRSRFQGRHLAVAAGRLDPLKDYESLLRAVDRARQRVPTLLLAVAGVGPEYDRLSTITRILELEDSIEFVGWVAGVENLLAAADVVVQASLDESFGQVVLEAMGLGVPVATTTPGGVREIVQPWYPDLQPGDVDGLASAIVDRLLEADAARRRAAEAAADVRLRFSASLMAEAQFAAYTRAMRHVDAP